MPEPPDVALVALKRDGPATHLLSFLSVEDLGQLCHKLCRNGPRVASWLVHFESVGIVSSVRLSVPKAICSEIRTVCV